MPQTHDPAQDTVQDTPANRSGVSTVPRGAEVRVARIDRKVLFWTVAVAMGVVGLSFVSIILHGLVLQGGMGL